MNDLKELRRVFIGESNIEKIQAILDSSCLPLTQIRRYQYLDQLRAQVSEQTGISVKKIQLFTYRQDNKEINLACVIYAGVDYEAYLFHKGESR